MGNIQFLVGGKRLIVTALVASVCLVFAPLPAYASNPISKASQTSEPKPPIEIVTPDGVDGWVSQAYMDKYPNSKAALTVKSLRAGQPSKAKVGMTSEAITPTDPIGKINPGLRPLDASKCGFGSNFACIDVFGTGLSINKWGTTFYGYIYSCTYARYKVNSTVRFSSNKICPSEDGYGSFYSSRNYFYFDNNTSLQNYWSNLPQSTTPVVIVHY